MVTYSGRTFAPKVYRTLEGRIVKETAKAILFAVIDKESFKTLQQDWFPKSQISSYGGTYDEIDGTFNYILATEWILKEKNLIDQAVKMEDVSKIKDKPLTYGGAGDTIKNNKANADIKNDEGIPPHMADDWAARIDTANESDGPPSTDDASWEDYMNQLANEDQYKD